MVIDKCTLVFIVAPHLIFSVSKCIVKGRTPLIHRLPFNIMDFCCTHTSSVFFLWQHDHKEMTKSAIPRLVSIRDEANERKCSGLVVNKSHILTSASCVESLGPTAFVINDHNASTNEAMEPRVSLRMISFKFNEKIKEIVSGNAVAFANIRFIVSLSGNYCSF